MFKKSLWLRTIQQFISDHFVNLFNWFIKIKKTLKRITGSQIDEASLQLASQFYTSSEKN